MSLLGLAFINGCANSRPPASPAAQGISRRYSPLPWRYYLTVSSEQMGAARSSPECQPAEADREGNWGEPLVGFQLSLRFQKQVFTNGEPVVACVTLRNVSDKVLVYVVGPYPEEKDTTFSVMKDQQRLYGADDVKPGASFLERLKVVRAGSSPGGLPILPGTQLQFFRDVSKVFDLSAGGVYVAQARRNVGVFDLDAATNILSGKATFEVVNTPVRH